jgi:phosphoglycerate dehydrogenase-like enzyme
VPVACRGPSARLSTLTGVPPRPPIAVLPDTRPDMHAAFVAAVCDGGGEVVDVADARALVWADPARADAFPAIAARAPDLEWVQLPYAGIEPFAAHLDARLVWTCGKGVYARPVAEHALGLALAGLRGLDVYARADSWGPPIGRNLLGANVTIVGGGGICDELRALLEPFGCAITVVRRHAVEMPGLTVMAADQVLEAVADADLVVLALALTPETAGMVDARFLDAMPEHAWLVNVARGAHVVTDDLVVALRERRIGGAALDVTAPEPLPADHPLWHLRHCIITPHIANTPGMGLPLIAARVRENTRRFATGRPLEGLVDVALGY